MELTKIFEEFLHFWCYTKVLVIRIWNVDLKSKGPVSWLQNPDLKRRASVKANKDELNTWMVEKKSQQNKSVVTFLT